MPTTATTLTASHAINRYCSRLLTFSSLSQAALSLLSSASKDVSVISNRYGNFLPNVYIELIKAALHTFGNFIPRTHFEAIQAHCDLTGQFRDVCLMKV
ncbi:hypothetical protein PSI22_10120 [Xenorhabdus sp. XENO-7]|uniref:Uncharacterized protein n=1 Tax=Xenorhabdus aichiensis TaxID=3025874 RepID=A0ABT5M707_9GAMM|nr:hypothetical protein [Xenorhabdus aichiensis]MDC9621987.1 hypothetical protein [Xenorhabdus aichiensis]